MIGLIGEVCLPASRDLGEVEHAGRLLEPALSTLRRQRRQGDWSLAQAEGVWASYLAFLGRFAEAEALLIVGDQTLLGLLCIRHRISLCA